VVTTVRRIEEQIASAGAINLEELGGVESIWRESDELASGPYFEEIVRALLRGWSSIDVADAKRFILSGVRTQQLPNRLDGAIEAVLAEPFAVDLIGADLGSELLERAKTRGDARSALLAALALEGALQLAIGGYLNRYLVLASLTGVDAREDLVFAQRVARLLGVAHDHWRDPELVAALDRLAAVHGAEADVAVELGLARLVTAVTANTPDKVADELEAARTMFETAEHTEEGRDDATAFRLICTCLLDLASGARGELIAPVVDELRASLEMATLWLHGLERRWLSPRASAGVEWLRLLTAIERAATNVDEPSWYRPAEAVAETVDAYASARAVRLVVRSQEVALPGVAAIVEPRIEAGFARHAGLRAHLTRWLEDEQDGGDDERHRVAATLLGKLAASEVGQWPFRAPFS
jgi:hypothetical protein